METLIRYDFSEVRHADRENVRANGSTDTRKENAGKETNEIF